MFIGCVDFKPSGMRLSCPNSELHECAGQSMLGTVGHERQVSFRIEPDVFQGDSQGVQR